MFGNSNFRLNQLFADQFEPDGKAFLYRKGMKKAPIRVTDAERNSFIATFKHRLRYANWSIVPATALLIGLLVVIEPDVNSSRANITMYIGLAAIIIPFCLSTSGRGTRLGASLQTALLSVVRAPAKTSVDGCSPE